MKVPPDAAETRRQATYRMRPVRVLPMVLGTRKRNGAEKPAGFDPDHGAATPGFVARPEIVAGLRAVGMRRIFGYAD